MIPVHIVDKIVNSSSVTKLDDLELLGVSCAVIVGQVPRISILTK